MKKLLSLLLCFAAALSLTTGAFAAGEDAPWYAEAQRYVTEKGVMTGTDSGFEPLGATTRAQMFRTLYNLEGRPAVSKAASFTDVAGKWYADAAAWAEQTGLAQGDGDGAFAGDRGLRRSELVTALYRYARDVRKLDVSVGEDTNILSYSDALTLPEWCVGAFQWACGAGVVTGKDGALAPEDNATRAELAVILMRFGKLDTRRAGGMVWIDVPEVGGIPAHRIPAIVTLPEGEGPFPAVVMLHGTGSNKNEAGGGYDLAAPALAAAGIASIRIDFMGSGDSTASYRDYNYSSANLDAKSAADYMARLGAVDANRIAVMGWSQGGTNALLAAAEYPGTFKAVVTWAGALDLTTMFENFDAAYETAKTIGSYEMTFDWRDPLPVGERWFREVGETDVLEAIEGLKAPVLSIHGDQDDTVPMADSENVQKTLGTNNLCVIEGADHTYNIFAEEDGATLQKAVNAGIAFLQKTLGGAVTAQEINSLVYTDKRADYDSDEIFANFREVRMGGIGAGKLYRSSSPVNNGHNRAVIADKLIEAAGIKTVMNLADTEDAYKAFAAEDTFASMYYKGLYDEGSVITLGMPVSYNSDGFAEGIVKGFTFLSERKGPYLLHCTEGRGRTGFAAMLLEAIMGAKLDDVAADYALSYVNYFHIDPTADAAKYQMIVEEYAMEAIRAMAGLEAGASLKDVDLAKAAETYLTSHGMSETALAALKANLK